MKTIISHNGTPLWTADIDSKKASDLMTDGRIPDGKGFENWIKECFLTSLWSDANAGNPAASLIAKERFYTKTDEEIKAELDLKVII